MTWHTSVHDDEWGDSECCAVVISPRLARWSVSAVTPKSQCAWGARGSSHAGPMRSKTGIARVLTSLLVKWQRGCVVLWLRGGRQLQHRCVRCNRVVTGPRF